MQFSPHQCNFQRRHAPDVLVSFRREYSYTERIAAGFSLEHCLTSNKWKKYYTILQTLIFSYSRVSEFSFGQQWLIIYNEHGLFFLQYRNSKPTFCISSKGTRGSPCNYSTCITFWKETFQGECTASSSNMLHVYLAVLLILQTGEQH